MFPPHATEEIVSLLARPSELGCAAIFGSKRIKANMKRIFIRFEANKTGFIRLFCIQANRRILHEKTNRNGSDYSLLSVYFQKEPNIN
jgi:hypothetical protein